MIDPTIFREYDIRGIIGEELTPESIKELAKGFVAYFKSKNQKSILIARDNRHSSLAIRDSLVSIFLANGFDVLDLGCVTSPLFYFASRVKEIQSGIMITASHNPKEYNGFKVLFGESTIFGEEIQKILTFILDKDCLYDVYTGKIGETFYWDPVPDYKKYLLEHLALGSRKIKVALDCGNGTAALTSPAIFQDFGIELVSLYCNSDPDFPNHFPDPVKVENMKDLAKAVRENHCDIGIGLDGDGDRIGVVDDKGNPVWGDMLMILFSREILKKYPGQRILVEVKCSQLVMSEIEKLGGIAEMYKTGHSLIKSRMKEIGAICAGEMSGHMFLKDEYFGFDDATYAALRLIRILSNSHQSISEMLSDLPTVYSTPEIRVKVPEKEKFEMVERAKKLLREHFTVNDIDGVRANINDGWGLIRASNTGPEVIIRAEAKSEENLAFIQGKLEEALSPLKIQWK
jgi:phosphomannomutase/phosphoglucomutase